MEGHWCDLDTEVMKVAVSVFFLVTTYDIMLICLKRLQRLILFIALFDFSLHFCWFGIFCLISCQSVHFALVSISNRVFFFRISRESKERRRKWAQRKTQRSSSAQDVAETEGLEEPEDSAGMLPSSIVDHLVTREKWVCFCFIFSLHSRCV